MSWVKKVFTDFTTIIDAAFLNGLQDQIITDEETLAAKAGQGSLAEAYSASSTYAVGDLCTHEGGLYQCTTAITTAEEWTAAHWEAVIIGDEVTRLNQAINVFDDIPGTTQTVNFGADGKPSSIIHTSGATTVRSDVFTWGTNTVTEVRTLADGKHITYVTNLDTLVTTISAIEEAS